MSSPTSGASPRSELARKVLAELHVTPDAERSMTQLVNALRPPSLDELAATLLVLLREGEVRAVYRVYDPDGHGLEDFEKWASIPEEMEDRNYSPFDVKLDDIDVIYRAAR